MFIITEAAPRWAIQFSASTSSGWPIQLKSFCTPSISLTPNIGAGDTMIAAFSPSRSCWNSLSASQSISPEGRPRLRSLRQRRVRVSRTIRVGLPGNR